jgi:hypothetical protein
MVFPGIGGGAAAVAIARCYLYDHPNQFSERLLRVEAERELEIVNISDLIRWWRIDHDW